MAQVVELDPPDIGPLAQQLECRLKSRCSIGVRSTSVNRGRGRPTLRRRPARPPGAPCAILEHLRRWPEAAGLACRDRSCSGELNTSLSSDTMQRGLHPQRGLDRGRPLMIGTPAARRRASEHQRQDVHRIEPIVGGGRQEGPGLGRDSGTNSRRSNRGGDTSRATSGRPALSRRAASNARRRIEWTYCTVRGESVLVIVLPARPRASQLPNKPADVITGHLRSSMCPNAGLMCRCWSCPPSWPPSSVSLSRAAARRTRVEVLAPPSSDHRPPPGARRCTHAGAASTPPAPRATSCCSCCVGADMAPAQPADPADREVHVGVSDDNPVRRRAPFTQPRAD